MIKLLCSDLQTVRPCALQRPQTSENFEILRGKQKRGRNKGSRVGSASSSELQLEGAKCTYIFPPQDCHWMTPTC
jgi:hypothetical protein